LKFTDNKAVGEGVILPDRMRHVILLLVPLLVIDRSISLRLCQEKSRVGLSNCS